MSDEFFEDKALIASAKEASKGSFSPISGFSVGSALLIEDDAGKKHIIQGSNYETQNYKSVCAERHALQSANLSYAKNEKEIKYLKIAIYSPDNFDFIFPCGDCRQALFEQNPKMEVICASSAGEYKKLLAEELLPNGFRLTSCEKSEKTYSEELAKLLPYIVHLPIEEDKLDMLKGLRHLLVVGSSSRAEKLAKSPFNLGDYEKAGYRCYCHPKLGNNDREYSLFVSEWRKTSNPKESIKIAIASHGIGSSGVEIILSEVNALIALANETPNEVPLKMVIRSGTRGTLDDIPLGTVAITTEAHNENAFVQADKKLIDELKNASESMDIEISEGPCFSSQFFWSGQGRTSFPLLKHSEELEAKNNEYLRQLKKKGMKWIEMEDYYVSHFASMYGMASASIGVVAAQRYNSAEDRFVLHYDSQTTKDKELIPAQIALLAIKNIVVNTKD
ncbi:MAG: hypothetical protein QNJ31_00360 [Candidatus Caenarcaniphilales bacterium]|nr:hypothetical protein [Candidatus Caenarcaniphilales bacterium]